MQDQDPTQLFQTELEVKLSILNDSKDSIVSASNFILKKVHSSKGDLAQTVCDTWAKMIVNSEKPLALVYVCNEILVNCVSGKAAGMLTMVKLMETRTSESFKKLCSQPGKLNQKTFDSLLRTLDVWLKRQIYSSSHIETLVKDLKGLFTKSEEQRKAAKTKVVKKPEIKVSDF